jgi:hypothetical protein
MPLEQTPEQQSAAVVQRSVLHSATQVPLKQVPPQHGVSASHAWPISLQAVQPFVVQLRLQHSS